LKNYQHFAEQCIAHGALTNSKRPSVFVQGIYPTHLAKGKGPFVWDVKGKRYHDFIGSLGAIPLGHYHPEVNKAIREQLLSGITFSLGTPLEVELAEQIKELFPCIELLRFLKTGTEACMAAVRIARAFTGRSIILTEGYHGWSDGFVSLTPPAHGVEGCFRFERLPEDLQSINAAKTAAIVVEPVEVDDSVERIERLQALRNYCTENGVLLIFDEIITGFRYIDFSVSNCHEIYPDLIVLGKAIANGMPLSVVGGRADVMSGDYFVSSTFAGETLSLAAAKATIEALNFGGELTQSWEGGDAWLNEFNALWPEKIRIEGYATRGRFVGCPQVRALFFQEACEAGLLFGPSWFYNSALVPENDATLSTVRKIICKLQTGSVTLRGLPPQPPLAEKFRRPSPTPLGLLPST
jgi:glutamate-1-semialdehyde 2,1-aminomutase